MKFPGPRMSELLGVNWFRQGFFPQARGEPGLPDVARIELVYRAGSDDTLQKPWAARPKIVRGTRAEAIVLVLFHEGGQAVAEERDYSIYSGFSI